MHRVVAQKRQQWQHHPPPRPVSRHRKFQNRQHHRKEAKHPEAHGLNRMFWFAAHAASRSLYFSWTLAITDRLNQQIPQRLSAELDFTQNVKHLTMQCLTGLIELFQQRPVNVSFAGLVGDQVPEMADLCLPDTVNATKALLDPVGIPR